MSVRTAVLLVAALSPWNVLIAQSSHSSTASDLSIGVRFGTLGIGGEISKLVTGHVGLRVGANFFSASTTKTQSDINYQASLKLKAITGLVDLYPGNRGSFHLTGGVITDPLSVTATGVPNGGSTYTINNRQYQASDVGTLSASLKYPSASPYVGIGFGTPASSHGGLTFLFDLGAAIGKPAIVLAATGTNAQLQSDLAAQQAKTQTDVNKVAKVYPALSLGLAYRF